MASSHVVDNEEIIDAAEELETRLSDEPSLPESSTSKKKKRKNKSKAAKVLNALRGNKEIPEALVEQVLDRVKAEHGGDAPGVDAENVRKALDQMKVMDVIQGKSGFGGKNKKDMGEHKVLVSFPSSR
jgi:glycylpeptide N-tetradecanoyltransferase